MNWEVSIVITSVRRRGCNHMKWSQLGNKWDVKQFLEAYHNHNLQSLHVYFYKLYILEIAHSTCCVRIKENYIHPVDSVQELFFVENGCWCNLMKPRIVVLLLPYELFIPTEGAGPLPWSPPCFYSGPDQTHQILAIERAFHAFVSLEGYSSV